MIKNLVLAGAQIKGISYIGSLRALSELGLLENIENICGVSSGSIVALCLFLELTFTNIEKLIFEVVNYEHIKSPGKVDICNLTDNYGFETGYNLMRIIELIIEKKTSCRDCTFAQLAKFFPNKKLIIVGTNLTDNSTDYFSIDTTPEMELRTAIRISISVPFIFTKVEYEKSVYVDGGVGCNFPMDFFADDIDNTLGIYIVSLNYIDDVGSFEGYMNRIFRRLMDNNDNYIIDRYRKNILLITVDYDYLELDLNKEKKQYLLDCGYTQTNINISKTVFKSLLTIKALLNNIIIEIEKNNM